jgi:hypothetical protein
MIYVECKPDVTLVKKLGVIEKKIFHAGGKSKVCKKLERNRNSKGLVDQDPLSIQPPYLDKLSLVYHQHKIKIFHDTERDNYVVVLCPRLEDWILEATKEAKVDIKRYNLPTDGDELHKTINTKIGRFEELIDNLRKKSKMMKVLEKFIRKGNLKRPYH